MPLSTRIYWGEPAAGCLGRREASSDSWRKFSNGKRLGQNEFLLEKLLTEW